MIVLDQLASHIASETSMQVNEAVLLLSSEDGLPRVRLAKRQLSRHALLSAPAGIFFCDLHSSPDRDFLAELESGRVDVRELTRLDPKDEIVVSRNWPARKVRVNGTFYTVPRNFAEPLLSIIASTPSRKRKW